ncbi:MAG TPA: hypothetical protein VJY65_03550 [Chloroflexota bacterium]|nr:hypothetical protein [Chloroflexota bacterium]
MSHGNKEMQLGVTTGPEGGADAVTRLDEEQVPRQRVVEVFGALADVVPYDQPVYRRTLTTRLVTFTCARCAQTVTQQHFPGPVPRYCGAWCRYQAQRAQTRERVRQHRARSRSAPDKTEA